VVMEQMVMVYFFMENGTFGSLALKYLAAANVDC